MKKILFIALLGVALMACEKEVYIPLPENEPFLVVDAWLDTREQKQTVTVTFTRPYFDNSQTIPARGAEVLLINILKEDTITFEDVDNNGKYVWDATLSADPIGETGDYFLLDIQYQGVNYQSVTQLTPVPTLDSITFEYYPKDAFVAQDYYLGDFWARDLPGVGNTYWIKTWKNGQFLNQPAEINYAYDGGFSSGAPVDSIIFIQPIRSLMNPFDGDDDNPGRFFPLIYREIQLM